MHYRTIRIFYFLFFCSIISFAQSPKEMEQLEAFSYKKNIVYKIIDGDTLDMILFLPKVKTGANMPVMVFIHGGGWGGGNKFKILGAPFSGTLKNLLDHGVACATIEYRLTRAGKSTAYDCVVDCKDAVRFLMKNSDEFSLDANRIGVWGDSAGGHLCLMTGLADNESFLGDKSLQQYKPRFLCVASYFPLTSFVNTEYLVGSNSKTLKD
jgi:acetyl esterase/lipase